MPVRVVFDCNVFLQAMLSSRGPSHGCWLRATLREVELVVAPFAIAEIIRPADFLHELTSAR